MTAPPDLPAQAHRWMLECLGRETPREARATCSDCAMRQPIDERLRVQRYDAATKCCTYTPTLPSYSVGRILGGGAGVDEGARASLALRVQLHIGATPLALGPTPAMGRLYEIGRKDFGRSPELVCPYYLADTGQCGIWSQRDAVCSTWFCKTNRRARGYRFHDQLKGVLTFIQDTLAAWCARELGITEDALAELHRSDGKPRSMFHGQVPGMDEAGRIAEAARVRIWGPWLGREEDYYRACAERVDPLEWKDVRAICGASLDVAVARLRRGRARLERDVLPAVLCITNHSVTPLGSDVALSNEMMSNDPLVLDSAVLRVLPLFDGRPTSEVRAAAAALGAPLDEDTVWALLDEGVLEEPDGHDLPPRERPTGELAPEDRLRLFRNFRESRLRLKPRVLEGGAAGLVLQCGVQEVELDEPDLLEFGRRLAGSADGFVARDATRWTRPDRELEWDWVSALLEVLVEKNVLQRLPPLATVSGTGDVDVG